MFGEDRERTVLPFFFAITLRTYIRLPENRSMTDGDCPVPDDATVILVDSLERARFSITDVYVCAGYKIILPFPRDRCRIISRSVSSASSCNC